MFIQLRISNEQLSVLNEGLMMVPYGRAAPVVAAINEQISQNQLAMANLRAKADAQAPEPGHAPSPGVGK